MWYGIVEDVDDPSKLGRVRVRVQKVHGPDVKTEDLSWSLSILPITSPSFKGVGHSINVLKGSTVVGTFTDNTLQDFLIMGTISTSTDDVKDINVRAKGEADPNADQTRGANEPPSAYAPEYPYNNVYETESGHVKEYDDTPGVQRIKERHFSGTSYEIQPDGSKIEKIVRDNYTLVMNNDTLEVHGTVNIIVSQNCNLAVAGYVTANVGGDIDIQAAGDVTVTSEKDITLITGTEAINRIKLDTPNVECTGSITAATTITAVDNIKSTEGDVIATAVSLKTHVHAGDGGDNSGSNTGVPV